MSGANVAVRPPRVLLLTNTSRRDTTGRLLSALAGRLETRAEVRLVELHLPPGVGRKLLRILTPPPGLWRALFRADVVVIHTAAAFTAGYVLGARLAGKRVVAFLWDVYPGSLIDAGQARGTLAMRAMGWVERRTLGLAHAVFVPTEDYLVPPQVARLGRAEVLAMWSYLPAGALPAPPPAPEPGPVLRVGFAGSINPIRDLPGALRALGAAAGGKVAVTIWSADRFDPGGLPDNVTVEHRGFVAQEELTRQLGAMDAGLVCLDPAFGWPSYPSKLFAYVAAGLPVVFRGPPAPALRDLLRRTGAGVFLDGQSTEVAAALRALRRDFAGPQAAFLAHAALDDAKLDRILGVSQSQSRSTATSGRLAGGIG